ncbi:hypothetical protein AAC387_Pa01g4343 [Persea americana]
MYRVWGSSSQNEPYPNPTRLSLRFRFSSLSPPSTATTLISSGADRSSGNHSLSLCSISAGTGLTRHFSHYVWKC